MKNSLLSKRIVIIILIIVCVTIEFQHSKKIIAQEDKIDRCELVLKKYGEAVSSYKDCFGVELIDTLSPKLVESFGITTLEDEWARLDLVFSQLANEPNAIGYIVIYGGRINKYGELKERPNTLKAYIKDRGYDPSRVKFIEGGFREKFGYEFWISPSEKMYPPITPTVEAEKVTFRGKMKPLSTTLYN